MLQDLVLTAINEALRKADDMMQDGLEGFNIPGLF
jgi:DNA-binding protein YbaB